MEMELSAKAQDLVYYACQPGQTGQQKKVAKKNAKALAKKEFHRKEFQFGYIDGLMTINFAVRGGHQFLVEILLKILNVDPKIPDNVTNTTSLHHAAVTGQVTMLDTLVTEYACPIDAMDSCGSTPLCLAILNGNAGAITWLIDHGASIEVNSVFGRPMHAAAVTNNVVAVRKMHERKAEVVNSELYGFCTPIVAALCGGSADCFEFLAEVTDLEGKHLVYKAIVCSASEERALECVEILLDHGADVNLFDEIMFEEIPILCAAKRGWRNVTKTLLPQTDQIVGVHWSVEGLIGYVATEEFKRMDKGQIEIRFNKLKDRLVEELQQRNFLAAYSICKILRVDMEEEVWDRYYCLYQVLVKNAMSSYCLECTAESIHLFGLSHFDLGDDDTTLMAAKACLALDPENSDYEAFYLAVLKTFDPSTSS